MSWSPQALAFFAERAIDPAVAEAAGVQEENDRLVYPHGRYRRYGEHTMQAKGEQVRPWPVSPLDGAQAVLISEGETDGLAAATALAVGPEAPGFRDLPVLAIPGCQYSPDIIARGLARYGVREAYVAYDADDPGRKAARALAGTLAAAKIRPLQAEPPQDDLAAWLASTEDPGEALASHLADAQPIHTGPLSLADVGGSSFSWAWRNRIPRGRISCIAGDPGEGKSMWTVALASELSREGKLIFMANDDDEPEDIQARVKAAKGDATRFRLVQDIVMPNISGLRKLAEHEAPDLVTIDPYHHFIADHINPMRVHEMKGALAPLKQFARDYDCAVVLVCHLNRSGEEENPIYRVPAGLRGPARSILWMKVLERNTPHERTQLEHIKCSHGPKQPPIKYRFDGSRLAELDPKPPAPSETQLAALGLEAADD